jgi:hypothetical protein
MELHMGLTFSPKLLKVCYKRYVSVCRSFFDEALEAIPPLTSTADMK